MIGIDVSNHQPSIDWAKVKAAGVTFAWLKATEGKTYSDPTFPDHSTKARSAGIRVGAYHYARPDNNTPAEEADHFLRTANATDGLRPVLDYEHDVAKTPAQLVAWAQEWLQRVESATGVKPVFYTYPWYWEGKLGSTQAFKSYPLWLASYGPNDGQRHEVRRLLPDWPIAVHQYTSNGRVDGIGSVVDMNYAESLEPITFGDKMTLPNWLETIDNVIHVRKWVYEFIRWRLVDKADPAKRPSTAPTTIPQPVWRVTEASHALAKEYAAPFIAERDKALLDVEILTEERDRLVQERDTLERDVDLMEAKIIEQNTEIMDLKQSKLDLESEVARLTAKVNDQATAVAQYQKNFAEWADEVKTRIFSGL